MPTDAVKAVWRNGQILPLQPVDWPEGSELSVQPVPSNQQQIGLTEEEWRDDPQAIADWDAWVNTIEPIQLTEAERAEIDRYREECRRFNLEAVRRQMETFGNEP